jgi:hypothetical protein
MSDATKVFEETRAMRARANAAVLPACSCDAFADDPCPVHADENREQDERIRETNKQDHRVLTFGDLQLTRRKDGSFTSNGIRLKSYPDNKLAPWEVYGLWAPGWGTTPEQALGRFKTNCEILLLESLTDCEKSRKLISCYTNALRQLATIQAVDDYQEGDLVVRGLPFKKMAPLRMDPELGIERWVSGEGWGRVILEDRLLIEDEAERGVRKRWAGMLVSLRTATEGDSPEEILVDLQNHTRLDLQNLSAVARRAQTTLDNAQGRIEEIVSVLDSLKARP